MNLTPPAKKTDLRALLLGLFLALSALATLGFSAFTLLFAASAMSAPDTSMVLTLFVFAGGLFFSALLLIPGIYLNACKFLNLPAAAVRFPPVSEAALLLALASLWVLALALGQVVSSSASLAAIVLPFLNIVAVGLPVMIFLRVALRKLELPSAQDGWSVFGITLVVGPVGGVLLEGIVFVIFIFIAGIYITTDRELAQQVSQLAQVFKNYRNSDTLLAATAPILFTPLGMLTTLGLFSVAVPAIEEAIKVSALWLFADKLKHPAQGFALGVLCGAAFALAENLGFASTGASEWLSTASLRATSALPHMLNSGILGWALVSAWKKRSYLKLAMAYGAVMLIHGTWNAISIALLLSSLASYAQNIPDFIKDPAPFLAGWIVLGIGAFAGLAYGNRVLRRSSPFDVEYNEPLLPLNSGENHGNSENVN